MAYDIFISYKRKSLAMANNLYYRLTMRGYSTFFDLEELGRDNFNTQLLTYIEKANDVFVILEEGSLDACKSADWQEDWFCREVAHALRAGKNIIPILLNGYEMPRPEELPEGLRELSMKHSPTFDFSYFNEYIDKLVEKKFITSKPQVSLQSTSTFKFCSNQDCEVYKEGKLVCQLEGNSDNLFYLPIAKKGQYQFKCVNSETKETKKIEAEIGTEEEKIIKIEWPKLKKKKNGQNKKENNRKNKILQILKTNVASIIAICFVVVSVVLVFTILSLNHSSDYGSKAYESVYSEDSTTEAPVAEAVPVEIENMTFNVNGVSFDMIGVEGGSFMMGSDDLEADSDERSVHEVRVSDFWIGETEVTQGLWKAVMGNNPSEFKKGDNYPIEGVSWNDCRDFVGKLNELTEGKRPAGTKFRLPTEAEWEYAARGGKHKEGYEYSGSDKIDQVALYWSNSNNSTHIVKEKTHNALGIYDMSGNVWEWCEDYYDEDYYDNSPIQDPLNTTKASYRVLRGGSWYSFARRCRVSNRNLINPDGRGSSRGMRLALSSLH